MTNTPDKIVYTASAVAEGGRRGGRATTRDGSFEVELNAPKELGGPGVGTNPEELFALGYSACFAGAVGLVAKNQGLDATGTKVRTDIGFGPEGASFGITADLSVEIPGLDLETAQQVVDAAHEVCPYSKATRGNVPVTVTAVASL